MTKLLVLHSEQLYNQYHLFVFELFFNSMYFKYLSLYVELELNILFI